ncbi:TPA: beta family protein, partial [Vibrio cholerae]|nr:beta family protein [Vibrio cholerae]
MSEYKYFPIIKTRDAELKCFQNLDKIILDQILPIYELTKSRKTTKTPDGDINRRMGQIKDIQGGNPFILDLCTDDKYINPQIEQLIDEYQGFQDWQYFLSIYKDLNIIPMVHLYEDANLTFEE